MSEMDAKRVIDELCKKHFRREIMWYWGQYDDDVDPYNPPHWNIFTLKAFTKDELYMLGLALTELATKDE